MAERNRDRERESAARRRSAAQKGRNAQNGRAAQKGRSAQKGKVADIDHYRQRRRRLAGGEGVADIGAYRNKRRRNLGIGWLMYVLFLMACLCAGYCFTLSPLFNIERIEVEGNQTVSAERVRELSGIEPGQNIFSVSALRVTQYINIEPAFYASEVIKKFPSTVIIRVYERQPLALIAFSGGFLQIDRTGMVLARLKVVEDFDLPVISGVSGFHSGIVPGTPIDSPSMAAALSLMRQFTEEVFCSIVEINVADTENIRLFMASGIELRIGDQTDFLAKYQVFCDIIEDEANKNRINTIWYIDVKLKNRPAISRK